MRLKCKCNQCNKTVLLFFDDKDDDAREATEMEVGSYIEHKCPVCNEWVAMEVVE